MNSSARSRTQVSRSESGDYVRRVRGPPSDTDAIVAVTCCRVGRASGAAAIILMGEHAGVLCRKSDGFRQRIEKPPTHTRMRTRTWR